jgi:hypothetical protein
VPRGGMTPVNEDNGFVKSGTLAVPAGSLGILGLLSHRHPTPEPSGTSGSSIRFRKAESKSLFVEEGAPSFG